MSLSKEKLENVVKLEENIIGSIILNPSVFLMVDRILVSNKMIGEKTSIIWQAILDVFFECDNSIHELTQIAIANKVLQKNDNIKVIGDIHSYLMDMQETIILPSSAINSAKELIAIYNEKALKEIVDRAGLSLSNGTWRNRYENIPSLGSAIVESIIKSSGPNISNNDLIPVSKIVQETFIDHVKNLLSKKGELVGLPTGFNILDNATSGLRGGQLIIIAARPGRGKTTLALNFLMNTAFRTNTVGSIYSLEMQREELMERILCSEMRYNSQQLKKGFIPQSKQKILTKSIDQIQKSNLYINDKSNMTIWEVMTSARKHKIELESQGKKLGLIVVDYIQLLSEPGTQKRGRAEEVAAISRQLKGLAKSLNVPVIALAQMNRSVEQRKSSDARPQLSDLKESGALEQDADIVMFLHSREKFGDEGTDLILKKRQIEVIIAKHRGGPTLTFPLSYRAEISRFDEWFDESAISDDEVSF